MLLLILGVVFGSTVSTLFLWCWYYKNFVDPVDDPNFEKRKLTEEQFKALHTIRKMCDGQCVKDHQAYCPFYKLRRGCALTDVSAPCKWKLPVAHEKDLFGG